MKISKKLLAATLSAAFILPVVTPAPMSHAMKVVFENQKDAETDLFEMMALAGKIIKTDEFDELTQEQKEWLFDEWYTAAENHPNMDDAKKREYANRLKYQLQRPEIAKIAAKFGIDTKTGPFIPNPTIKMYDDDRKLVSLASQIPSLDGYKSLVPAQRAWFESVMEVAGKNVRENKDWENTYNKLMAELNRYDMAKLAEAVGISPKSDYYEDKYVTEIKDLIITGQKVMADELYDIAGGDIKNELASATRDAVLVANSNNDTEIKSALDRLKKVLNNERIKPIAKKVNDARRLETFDYEGIDPAKIAKLEKALADQELVILSAQDILNNYPKTIRGKEEKLVDLLYKAQRLRIHASVLYEKSTGKTVRDVPINIPEKYQR